MRECPTCFSCYDDSVAQCPTDGRSTFHSLPGGVVLEGKYVLESRLGEGGMGIVYKAHHKFLKTTRAIKIIKLDLIGNDASFAKRFHQEAMAAATIGHPNIISVPDFGLLDDKIPYIVMEYVEGVSLQTFMTDKGRFTPEEALEYMQVIASAVGAAHKIGIVHRDLKPLNIMIEPRGRVRDQVRILDFGLAKIKSADLFGSFVGAQTTGIIGSPYYMAPEQWSEEDTDKRCDVYSLGIILYQMLTGEVPFKGSSIPVIMKKHLMSPPPSLAVPGSGISPKLEKVIHHALEKEPKMRMASVEDFIEELEQAVLHPVEPHEINGAAFAKPDSLAAHLTIRDDPADQGITQVLSSMVSPFTQVQIENNPTPVPIDRTLNLPLANQSDLPRKPSEEVTPTAETPAPPADNKRGYAQDLTSRPPLRSEISNLSPGNVVIGQHSTVGVLLKKRFVIPTAAGVVFLSLMVLVTFIYTQKGPDSAVQELQAPMVANNPVAANKTREMVFIEGGTFTMGSNNAGQEQDGEHQVSVSSYYLDKYEVTNAEYAEFIKDTNRRAPTIDSTLTGTYWEPWNGNSPPAGRERWPVTNVSVKDAEDFAAWLSKRDGVTYRLPKEDEWEFAARNGTMNSLFPWGNSWEEGRANINEKQSPANVGSFPQGATQSGVQDLIGNVWEWTSSKARFYDNSRVKSSAVNARVQRGGSFFERIPTDFHNATDRSWLDNEYSKFPTIGFRLARDRK
ncbi:MAG TPA: bifunctional serine/threonine-protein kinase/formylglycine-generating enzyme family protein [Pyrinomonadaceae bacterium]|nr:bifunctional serine/threonine-protein kinase/formylglycine-generating enzyme family protein [Pyrinomonadaceae bacterium]